MANVGSIPTRGIYQGKTNEYTGCPKGARCGSDSHHFNEQMTTKMILAGDHDLVSKATSKALSTLVEGGLPVDQAMRKLGITKGFAAQINKIADAYIDYYIQGEEVYAEKLSRNTPKMQAYIEGCVDLRIAAERADAEFASVVVNSIMSGVRENPELALKVAERRWAPDWSPKQQVDIKKETIHVIKQIVVDMGSDADPIDVEYEEA